MNCLSCEDRQQWLLDCGDGSQVLCNHLKMDEAVDGLSAPSTSFASTTFHNTMTKEISEPHGITTKVASADNVGRKFITQEDFLRLGDDNMKRKIKPIQKWSTLTEGEIYLMKRVISVKTNVNEDGYYVELKDVKNVSKEISKRYAAK